MSGHEKVGKTKRETFADEPRQRSSTPQWSTVCVCVKTKFCLVLTEIVRR
ncbi:unnamed protein product [Spirodela intermedia]|uniref:Uncharacterized protein n=1 Tax=Spirodela intermedia TaxID=51605 RepID=A0A7I8K274_SPIIN|nr:unnamed protein product [Spirodela intermedia]